MTGTDSPFWRFSLELYAKPGIPDACLALQDSYTADVNLLFYLIFLALHGKIVTASDARLMESHICPWRVQVVKALREIRRGMKGGISPVRAADSDTLRDAIKKSELAAERLQQLALERDFPVTAAPHRTPHSGAIEANIKAYGELCGGFPQTIVTTLITHALTCRVAQNGEY